jgi:hypothetical protein
MAMTVGKVSWTDGMASPKQLNKMGDMIIILLLLGCTLVTHANMMIKHHTRLLSY